MLDIRTMLGADALLQLCCAGGLWAIGRQVAGLSGLRWFQWAYVCTALGLGCACAYGPESGHALFGARCLVMASAVLMTQGVAEYVASSANLLPWGGAFLLLFAVLDSSADTSLPPNAAATVFCLFFAAQLLIGVLVLQAHKDAEERFTARAAAWMMGATALLCVVRAVVSPWRTVPTNPMANDPLRFAGLTVFMVFSAAMAFGFIGMATMRLQRQLETEARTDALTGLLNRRALEQAAPAVLAACRKRGTSLAVLALDLDRFKWINDTHGHDGGDAVLCAAAQVLSQGLRDSDLLARVGGEEFVVMLPTRGARAAFEVAERLRTRLEGLTIQYEGRPVMVTGSFGVAALGNADISWGELFRRADRWLYLAKQSGRNCTRGEGDTSNPAGEPAPMAGVPEARRLPVAPRLASRTT